MKRLGVRIFHCILLCGIALLCWSGGYPVLAREGLSDAELYGDGQESVLYQGSSHKSYDKGATSRDDRASDGVRHKQKEKALRESSGNATPKIENGDKPVSLEAASKDNRAASGEAALKHTDNERVVRDEDIVIEGVEADGIYNKDIMIEVSVLEAKESSDISVTLRRLLEEHVASGDGEGDIEETGNQDETEDQQVEAQIGLSAVGQLMAGRKQVSKEGRYELVIQQETANPQGETKEQAVIKRFTFMLDKTAPAIDCERINRLCEKKIDIKEICTKAVQDSSDVTTACYVNEQQLTDGVIERPGEYELLVHARDKAGNESKEQIQLTLQDEEVIPKQRSRWMISSAFVMMLGGGLWFREWQREKKEAEYEEVDEK